MSEEGNAARFLKAEYRKSDGVWTLIPGNRLPDNKNNRKKLEEFLTELSKDSTISVRVVLYEVTEKPLEVLFGDGKGIVFSTTDTL